MKRPLVPSRSSGRFATRFTAATVLIFVIGLGASGHLDSLARDLAAGVARFTVPQEAPAPEPSPAPEVLVLSELPGHPSAAFAPYFPPLEADSAWTLDETTASLPAASIERFHRFLDRYGKRQGVDDNFTIRVSDRQTGDVLEVFELADLRDDYYRGRRMDWGYVDRFRRSETNRLIRKYVRAGIDRDDVVVKWGRADQVRQANERALPYNEYEIRLARALGMSLLPTQIATVETFNRDDLVSPVGARSRYQIMPGNLERAGLHHYRLRTTDGSTVRVREETHPLLALEPAFVLLKGFSAAVGHEVPGISAYHAGPGNVYRLYRHFLREPNLFTPSSTVLDAYVWGVTDGFDRVRKGSSFGSYSRAYVASVYGALQAVDSLAVDSSATFIGDLVRLKPGNELALDSLLALLVPASDQIEWSPNATGSFYERFRAMNPHLALPAAPDSSVPPAGNVMLVASVNDRPVRFFLPIGSTDVLHASGAEVIDGATTTRFDKSTYVVAPDERTVWDRRYDALLADVARFGFTRPNRARLLAIHDAFADLAARNPTPYRRMQLEVVRTHRRTWLSYPWTSLERATTLANQEVRMRVRAPELLPVDPLAPFSVDLRPPSQP